MAVTGWVPSCLTLETVREGLIQLIGQSQNASSCTQCVCVPGNSAETSSDRASPKRKFLQSHLPGPKLSIVPPSSSYKKAIPCFRYHQAAARSAFRATTCPPRPKRLRHNSDGETSRCTTLAAQSVAPSIPVPSVCVRARWIQPLSKVDSLSTPCGWYFQAHASSELYLPRRRESDVWCWSHT